MAWRTGTSSARRMSARTTESGRAPIPPLPGDGIGVDGVHPGPSPRPNRRSVGSTLARMVEGRPDGFRRLAGATGGLRAIANGVQARALPCDGDPG
jgi:hypothetical protein